MSFTAVDCIRRRPVLHQIISFPVFSLSYI
ncbi:hypothetical protein IL54_4256 [Sphingobium sp. ba1]|nr:hypothetical protein IL54_4256 [Sphingobium sp. ba1]